MKKIKLFLCFFTIFFTCSCKVEINLRFDASFNVEEEIKLSSSAEYIYSYYNSKEEFFNYFQNYLNKKNIGKYDFKILEQGDSLLSVIEKKYETNTFIEEKMFSSIKKDGLSYIFVIDDNANELFEDLEMVSDPEEVIDEMIINIQFSHNVFKHNADKYDSRKNIYTWIINKDNLNRNIEFTLTNEKRYDIIIPYLLKKYIGYIILGTLLIAGLIFILAIFYKSKRENEI